MKKCRSGGADAEDREDRADCHGNSGDDVRRGVLLVCACAVGERAAGDEGATDFAGAGVKG